jgi:hypothetical protein
MVYLASCLKFGRGVDAIRYEYSRWFGGKQKGTRERQKYKNAAQAKRVA